MWTSPAWQRKSVVWRSLIWVAQDARLTLDAEWDESKHKRGQPENKGQFGSGGGSLSKEGSEGSGRDPVSAMRSAKTYNEAVATLKRDGWKPPPDNPDYKEWTSPDGDHTFKFTSKDPKYWKLDGGPLQVKADAGNALDLAKNAGSARYWLKEAGWQTTDGGKTWSGPNGQIAKIPGNNRVTWRLNGGKFKAHEEEPSGRGGGAPGSVTYGSFQFPGEPPTDSLAARAIDAYFEPDLGASINAFKINAALASGQVPAKFRGVIRSLDSYLAKSTVTESIDVYRGIGNVDLSQYKPGSVITQPRYTSTSRDPEVAERFATHVGGEIDYGAENENPGRFVISLPSGANAAPLDWIGGKSHEEKEVLLPRGQKFQVERVDPKTRTMHLTAVPS